MALLITSQGAFKDKKAGGPKARPRELLPVSRRKYAILPVIVGGVGINLAHRLGAKLRETLKTDIDGRIVVVLRN